jgi:hypothetical protein
MHVQVALIAPAVKVHAHTFRDAAANESLLQRRIRFVKAKAVADAKYICLGRTGCSMQLRVSKRLV